MNWKKWIWVHRHSKRMFWWRCYHMIAGACDVIDGLSQFFSLGFLTTELRTNLAVWNIKRGLQQGKTKKRSIDRNNA